MSIGVGWELPEADQPWSDFHWFQVGVRVSSVFVVLSERPLWYTGHYVKGRMRPCVRPGCPECADGVGGQIRYCFGVAEEETRRTGLIEFGRGNGLLIRAWAESAGYCRGLVFEAHKAGRQAQSRTELILMDREPPPWALEVDAPDVQLALYLTWEKGGFRVPAELREHFGGRLLQGHTPRGSYT